MVALWWGLVGSAYGQDAVDLLNVARRAAVVDEVLTAHEQRLRSVSTLLGKHPPRVRGAFALSYGWVPSLSYDDPNDGLVTATLDRSFTGFVFDVLPKADPDDDSPRIPVFSLSGGGISYGLQRPFELQSPVGTESVEMDGYGDRVGTQFSDEQYVVFGRWSGWQLDGSWMHSTSLEADVDGQVMAETLAVRNDRVQARLRTPLGFALRARTDDRGAFEDVTVRWTVNDGVAAARPPLPDARQVPEVDVGFRGSDYGESVARSNPRVASVGLRQDVAALLPEFDDTDLAANLRAELDFDFAQGFLQLALVDAVARVSHTWFEVGVEGGVSLFQDSALWARQGHPRAPGVRVAADLTLPVYAGTAFHFGYALRQSWAEEVRQLVELVGARQQFVVIQFVGGR